LATASPGRAGMPSIGREQDLRKKPDTLFEKKFSGYADSDAKPFVCLITDQPNLLP
jgi:hypothetical protein